MCTHDICEVGVGLNQNCDPCVSDICASDPFCCQVDWDFTCIEQVLTVCEDWICAAACSHNLCEIGEPLDSTCHPCAAQVCFQDPSCCADGWDASCIAKVQQYQQGGMCNFRCEPGANRCSDATPIASGRIFGTLTGSTNDGCDADLVSCRSGDVWYKYTQVVDQAFVFDTCRTERSYGIDSVLSIHEGCPGVRANALVSNDDYGLGFVQAACAATASPNFLDAAVRMGGESLFALAPGETVVIRLSHHLDSIKGNFELKILPEPEVWLALVAGAGALGALSRRRARR